MGLIRTIKAISALTQLCRRSFLRVTVLAIWSHRSLSTLNFYRVSAAGFVVNILRNTPQRLASYTSVDALIDFILSAVAAK